MQEITYNNVTLEIVQTLPSTREAILTEDTGTYLYTKWTINVIAHVAAEISAVGGPPKLPGVTENEIRNELMQPRRQLKVVAGGAEILYSPARRPNREDNAVYPCDAKNGPICTVFAIQQIVGVTMFVVHCRFETWMVEYPPSTPSLGKLDNVVLSNRWTSVEDIDELCYPTRYVVGEAILRTDFMRQLDQDRRAANPPLPLGQANFNAAADDLRKFFFFPIPQNYQRQNIRTELSTDGSRLKWSFEDVGRCYNLGVNSPIRKIEVYRNSCAELSGPLRPVADAFWGIAGAAENFATNGGAHNPGITSKVQASLPKYYISVRVDLWGDRNAFQGDLFALALGVCMNQVGFNQAVFTVGTCKIVSSQALHEKFARVELTVWWGEDANLALASIPLAGPLIALTNIATGLRSLLNTMCPLDPRQDKRITAMNLGAGSSVILDQTGLVNDNPTLSFSQVDNVGLSVGKTGGLICALVSQILEEPNQAPLIPTIPMPAT